MEAVSKARADLAAALSQGRTSEWDIWPIYLAVEVSIFDVKLALGEDEPGTFADMKVLYREGERQLMEGALASLERANEELAAGGLKAALSSLRDARNKLRAQLRAKRKEKKKLSKAA